MCIRARVFMLWLRRRRLPEQVDRAGSIALVPQASNFEEGRFLHTKSVTRAPLIFGNPPIVTGGVEIRRLPCLFLSRSNGGVCVCAVEPEKGRFHPLGASLSKPVHVQRFMFSAGY